VLLVKTLNSLHNAKRSESGPVLLAERDDRSRRIENAEHLNTRRPSAATLALKHALRESLPLWCLW